MIFKQKLLLLLFLISLLLGACSSYLEPIPAQGSISSCQLVYDAGSSGTRLYIYELTSQGWTRHRGPRTGALADPVRGIRGKTMADAGVVVDDIVAALENMRKDGPPGKKGEPKWPAFDWRKQCDIEVAAVYATAGMRLAEELDAEASQLLWSMLNEKLSAMLGMSVTTRTLSGYEEGLFAWLAIREQQEDELFGVVEMGGASVQVTFPCSACKAARQVRVQGRTVPIYSHSFLGWGQDEAWKKFGNLSACEHGAGIQNPDWRVTDCAAEINMSSDIAVDIKQKVQAADTLVWYLSGAFRHMQDTDIDQYCRKGIEGGYKPVSSCFRAVYLQNMLNTLGLPEESGPSDVDWTLGAVVCTDTHCLDQEIITQ